MKGTHPDTGAEAQDPKPSSLASLFDCSRAPRPLGQPRTPAMTFDAGADGSTMCLADPVVVAAPGDVALLPVAEPLHNDIVVTNKL